MALVEIFHVIADHYATDPNWSSAIIQGMLVRLTQSGDNVFVAPATQTSVIGLAGDTQSNDTAGTKYSARLVIGASGNVASPTAKLRPTSNRVSDMFNETLASGRMTVYTSGGKFGTDQYETQNGGSPITYAVNDVLYASANGKFTNVNGGSALPVAKVVKVPSVYPNGVPGTETPDGSMALGTFLTFKLTL